MSNPNTLFSIEYRHEGAHWFTVVAADSANAAMREFQRVNPHVNALTCYGPTERVQVQIPAHATTQVEQTEVAR